MVGGTILNFITQDDIVTFHVQEIQSTSKCHVKALMDEHAQKLIDQGAEIWWDSEVVHLNIGDVSGCKFPKIGFSY